MKMLSKDTMQESIWGNITTMISVVCIGWPNIMVASWEWEMFIFMAVSHWTIVLCTFVDSFCMIFWQINRIWNNFLNIVGLQKWIVVWILSFTKNIAIKCHNMNVLFVIQIVYVLPVFLPLLHPSNQGFFWFHHSHCYPHYAL